MQRNILCMLHITDESAGYANRPLGKWRKNGLGLRLVSEHPVHEVHVQ